MTGIVGVLLAAGRSARFGAHKLLAGMSDGEPVGLRAARHLMGAVPESVAVIRPDDHALSRLLSATGLAVIENPGADSGIAGSIAAGVSARRDAEGWLVALADMPWIRPATIRSVADALREGAALAAPTFDGVRGHPVGFSARWRQQLLSLSGDRGARDLIEKACSELLLVPTTDPGILKDIDVASDLRSRHWAADGLL